MSEEQGTEQGTEQTEQSTGLQYGDWTPPEDSSLSKFKTAEELGQSYLNLEKRLSSSIDIPGEESGPEQRAEFLNKLQAAAPELMLKPDFNNREQTDEFYQTLGKPKEAEGYTIPEIPNAPENLDMSEAEAFKAVAHKAGLTDKQYQAVVAEITNANLQAQSNSQQDFAKATEALKQEWGMAYDDRFRLAAKVAEATKAPEELQQLINSGYVDPSVTKWLYSLGTQLMGQKAELSLQPSAQNDDTPERAQKELSDMMNNKEHPIWQPHHPDHQRALERKMQLHKMAAPDAQTSMDPLKAGFSA